jgi:hypothetical protein
VEINNTKAYVTGDENSRPIPNGGYKSLFLKWTVIISILNIDLGSRKYFKGWSVKSSMLRHKLD